jgi:hypothetical protein
MDAQPPIVFIDENGDVGPLFASIGDLVGYLEWPEQFDDPRVAYDAGGRRIDIRCESNRGPVVVAVSPDRHPDELAGRLRPLVRDRPVAFGLIDADVDIDVLLRALWPRMRYGRGPFPTT